jgi:hypothetical protein
MAAVVLVVGSKEHGVMSSDVPSPIDLRLMSDASEWEATAMEKRPWRREFFAKFADELANMEPAITNQAVHELRHKRYAEKLHRQVARVLRPGGTYLVCDHFSGPEGMANDQLYMTAAEQKSAIESAGYTSVCQVLLKGGMVLHRATARASPRR